MKFFHSLQFLIILLSSTLSLAQIQQIEWEKSFGGSNWDEGNSVQQTSDGGYILAGTTSSDDGDVLSSQGGRDFWIVKTDALGTIQWRRTFGGTNFDGAKSIRQTADGGYIIAGDTYSNDGDVSGNNGGYDIWVVKLSSSGIINWQKTFGGSSADYANSIEQTTDGGYIVAGSSGSNDGDLTLNNGNVDCWVIKLDAFGTILWEKSLGGSGGEEAESIQQTTDGGYILAGNTSSSDGDISVNKGQLDYWVVKLDPNGLIQWEKSLGGSNAEFAYSIDQTIDGGYIVAGSTLSDDGDITIHYGDQDFWIVKLDANGALIWEKSIGTEGWEVPASIQQTLDGGYIVAGEINTDNSFLDCWIVKLNATGDLVNLIQIGGSSYDFASSIQQTADGNFIVSGTTQSSDGNVSGNNGLTDAWIIKLSAELSIEEVQLGDKEIVKIVNLIGQETEFKLNTPLIYIFSDGTAQKVFTIE